MLANYNGGGGGALPRRCAGKRRRLHQHICSPAIRRPAVLQRRPGDTQSTSSLSRARTSPSGKTRRRPPPREAAGSVICLVIMQAGCSVFWLLAEELNEVTDNEKLGPGDKSEASDGRAI